MNYFRKRELRKLAKHFLREARHAHHMRSDVASSKSLEALKNAEDQLTETCAERDYDHIESRVENVAERIVAVYPPRSFAKLRENIEILAVAITIAMAFRTYFIQPFKIPTGSMQPTLYGITYQDNPSPSFMDKFPLNLLKFITVGEWYCEVKAQVAGQVTRPSEGMINPEHFYIEGRLHEISTDLNPRFSVGDYVRKGQVLASGVKKLGDHIFVDKIRYNFSRPKRGDIIVFDTDLIAHESIKKHTFYIKRLAGLPEETISIQPPNLIVNGKKMTEPEPFRKMLEDQEEGYYPGYSLAKFHPIPPVLQNPEDEVTLQANQFLPLGDNTMHGLDGRYFGPVNLESLVGPAFAIYWPVTGRTGRTH